MNTFYPYAFGLKRRFSFFGKKVAALGLIRKCVGGWLLWLTISMASAQNERLFFEHIGLEKGLSQSTINCILQDSLGFIWFGTKGGLNRFDGENFKVFLYNPADSNSLANNIIYALYEDTQGYLWIGTQDGLTVYDRTTERFRSFKKKPNDPNGISNNVVKAITADASGGLWIGTENGLNRLVFPPGFSPITAQPVFTLYQPVIGNPLSVSDTQITTLLTDSRGLIWVGTASAGLNKLIAETGHFIRYLPENGLAGTGITALFEDSQQELWIGTNAGLSRMSRSTSGAPQDQNERIVTFRKNPKDPQSLSSNKVRAIFEGRESGHIWVGTDGDGLNSYHPKRKRFSVYQHDFNDAQSLVSNVVLSVFDDRNGTLWIGTNSGISRLDKQGSRFRLFQKDPSEPNGLSSNNIQTLYKEIKGLLWIGTFDGGLNMYDERTGLYTVYTPTDKVVNGESQEERRMEWLKKYNKKRWREKLKSPAVYLSDKRILSLHRDKRKTLWIGTGSAGLCVLDLEKDRFSYFNAVPDNPDSLSHNTVRTIFEDQKGDIWLGTEGGGLNRFDGKRFNRYVNDENNFLSLSNNDVRAIQEDLSGRIWVGTYGGGLNLLNAQKNTFKRYTKEDGLGLSSNVIFCLENQKDTLWAGTTEGLNMIVLHANPDSVTFKSFTVANGLPNNLVYGILRDEKGFLWLSTNQGISRFNIEEQSFKNYDYRDGLQSNEFNPGAYYRKSDGEILMGGINGFNTFYPSEISDNLHVPKVVITDLKIFNKSVVPAQSGSLLSKSITFTDTLELQPEDLSFTFEYVGISFTRSEKNSYAYMLENFEENWNYVGNRKFATYTNLSPGTYIFKVKAANNDGIWNEEGSSVTIIVHPPIWQTPLFRILAIAAFMLFSLVTYRARVRTIKTRQKELERQVQERTAEIRKQKDEIEIKNTELEQQKEEIASQRDMLSDKNDEIMAQRNSIEEKRIALEKAQFELMNVNTNLEKMVEERTLQLKDTVQQLSATNHELDTFIYRASHDLKGPLARLHGLAKVALLDPEKHNNTEYLHNIELAALDMRKTLEKLMQIHVIKEELLISETSTKKLATGVVKRFELLLKDQNVQFEPVFDSTEKIKCCTELVSLMIDNMMENAILFRNELNPLIKLKIWVEENHLHIDLKDNGIGIAEEHLPKIFDMFYRGHERSQGNGLGLYLVQKAVERLAGTIQVHTEKDIFTAFLIKIPLIS